ncbi:DNA-binding transcriptional regulator, MarR family [Mycolicibacterium rutilum]|uniref:DNA-binding transcriptional regulator, MarR family n=1 Tax=Mycolicibacterium rutilum TaxID=370526 RepID=A0A1H6ISG5_MYCRU|nr:MarR family winged helix-turn-helix transcriptional regulator [Mycolicibacterium rutilum]SEH52588.1 DNA-binding transcriptional regulator, MarR family [Mycolicibacterium rutilum]
MPYLSAPLLVHLARRVQNEADAALGRSGLRARHVIAMTLLRDLGEQNQSDMSATLGVDATNVVVLLNELEADGLVERRRSAQDRRRHTVSLTDAGARQLAEIETMLSGVERRVLGGLSADEQAQLYALLARATSNVTCTEAAHISTACLAEPE